MYMVFNKMEKKMSHIENTDIVTVTETRWSVL